MTRSQKFLHLTRLPIPGNKFYQRSSQFWGDVPASKWVRRKRPDYVEVYELEERKRKPRPVDEDVIEEVTRKLRRAADALRTGRVAAIPARKKCPTCDQRGICPAGCAAAA